MKKPDDCIILGIETSCDETSAAVLKNGRVVLSNIISSQIDIHQKYGGVVPEIASRAHVEAVSSIVALAMAEAGVAMEQISAVAVTAGPGLVGALLVGLSYGKALAYALGKPLIGVHHIEGHICANYLEDGETGAPFAPPFVCLVVSGGHTNVVHVPEAGVYRVLGRTKDDAAGEAFDKVARALGLPYPGGPQIDMLAKEGDPNAFTFPRAKLTDNTLDFSFSGLKSAVLNTLNKAAMTNRTLSKADIAASFQNAVIDVLATNTMAAAKRLNVSAVALAGGVSCNSALRARFKAVCAERGLALFVPKAVYCTDNAAMIAARGYERFQNGESDGLRLNAAPGLKLGEKFR